MFESLTTLAITNLGIAILALIISASNFFYTKKRTNHIINYQNEDFTYKKNKDKEDFILKFKEELHEFRLGLNELTTTKEEINYKDKDKYLYLVESKYDSSILKKYLSESKYKKYLDLTKMIDSTLDEIIYKQNYSNVFFTSQKIRFFFNGLT